MQDRFSKLNSPICHLQRFFNVEHCSVEDASRRGVQDGMAPDNLISRAVALTWSLSATKINEIGRITYTTDQRKIREAMLR